jgi:3-methyl-2-oxobutanoate hydroxymethyltransferase
MPDKMTVPRLRALREQGQPIVCLTAYDAAFGAMADAAGVDLVLVGDSVGTVMYGYSNTVPVTLDLMVQHTRATRAGVSRALLVADLPFGSYQASPAQAVESAVALMQAGASAVKLEGDYPDAIAALVRAGIPTMGHVGMTPQSYHQFGGHRVQGKGEHAHEVIDMANRVDAAGAFGMVVELVPAELAQRITQSIQGVTIGIGAGPHCHGQVQVLHDVLGFGDRTFRHAKRYMDGRGQIVQALEEYARETRTNEFPQAEHSV